MAFSPLTVRVFQRVTTQVFKLAAELQLHNTLGHWSPSLPPFPLHPQGKHHFTPKSSVSSWPLSMRPVWSDTPRAGLVEGKVAFPNLCGCVTGLQWESGRLRQPQGNTVNPAVTAVLRCWHHRPLPTLSLPQQARPHKTSAGAHVRSVYPKHY